MPSPTGENAGSDYRPPHAGIPVGAILSVISHRVKDVDRAWPGIPEHRIGGTTSTSGTCPV